MSLTTDNIIMHPYDSTWPLLFEAESQKIQAALGDNCLRIHHIGSTAVPGLTAKPIIDMIPVVRDIAQVDETISHMEALGYTSKGEHGMLFRRFFQKKSANIHVYEQGSGEMDRCLKFRDWMRDHPTDRQAYSDLKISLAQQFPHSISDYVFGKDKFVASIDEKTQFSGIRIVKALTPSEWKACAELQKEAGFDFPLVNDDSHFYMVLYQGAKIVCVAYFEFLEKDTALLHFMNAEQKDDPEKVKPQMRSLLKRWALQQGRYLKP